MGGRGRGRGRGGLGFQRHDIQLGEEEKTSDVPLLYPPCPGMPPTANPSEELDAGIQRLLKRYNSMRTHFTKSAFHMKLPVTVSTEGSVPDVKRHLDADTTQVPGASKQTPLSQVVLMHAKYLPKELYSARDQARSMSKRSAAFFKENGRLQDEALEKQLKALAAEDAKSKENGEDEDEGGPGAGKDEEPEEEEDDDDDLDHEDDDYYQGRDYQDDEEYGEEAGGGNDEPYF